MRLGRALLLFFLIVGCFWLDAPAARAIEMWQPAARYPDEQVPDGGAVTLPDGRALYLGFIGIYSTNQVHGSAALYDPATDRWQATAPLDYRQGFDTPVLLNDGRVLVIGGGGNSSLTSHSTRFSLDTAQLYDPVADSWSAAGKMKSGRGGHTATLLGDGSVLVVGGDSSSGSSPVLPTASAERYVLASGQWVPAASLAVGRVFHTATRLADGRVLVVGGDTMDPPSGTETLATAEIYDPVTDQWSSAGALATPRKEHTATLLGDGRVLVVGGILGANVDTAEIYNPATNLWTTTKPLHAQRSQQGAVSLADGSALIIGGDAGDTTERYDPAQDRWVAMPPAPRHGIAHRLSDGRVLLASASSAGSALFVPEPQLVACFAETGHCVRGRFLTYWQEHGGLALNGFPISDERIEVLEDGKAYTVQYFERVRMEYHPENAGTAYDVLLGQFGRRVYLSGGLGGVASLDPVPAIVGQTYFTKTGHNVDARFIAYWQANGGLAQFGFPLTERFEQNLEDGKSYQVQYFERARFEYHPENAGSSYEVLLGQFGRQILAEADLLQIRAGREAARAASPFPLRVAVMASRSPR